MSTTRRPSRIARHFFEHKTLFLWGFLAMALVTAGSLSGPLVIRAIIDQAIPQGRLGYMLLLAGSYLLIVLAMGAFQWFGTVTIGRLGLEVVTRVKKEVFSHFLRLPVAYFDAHPVGELMSRTESDTEKIRELFSRTAIILATDLLLFLGILGVCFTLEPRVTLWLGIVTPFVLGLVVLIFGKLRTLYDRHRVLYASTVAGITEFIQGIEVLRAFARLPWAEARLGRHSKERRDIDVRASLFEYLTMGGLGFALGPLFMAIVVATLAPGIIGGAMTIGTLLVFLEYGRRIFDPIMSIAESIRSIQQASVSLKRIEGILGLEEESGRGGAAASLSSEIEFRGVWFAYKGEDWVLEDLNFTMPVGTMTALVGPSGSGKTTTVGLLTRFYRPQKGGIFVDGRPLEELDLDSWRRVVGLVLQDSYLFPGSILENVRIYDEEIDEARVLHALGTVSASDFVERLPGGLHAEVKEGGHNMSAGERQLLSFARAVAFDPRLIILDEATSSIDVRTERKIREGMGGLVAGRTALVVAHRLSSVLRADSILYFRKGRIVARGRHEELLAGFPDYAELVRLQFPEPERVEEEQ